jgi:hypothetical protein
MLRPPMWMLPSSGAVNPAIIRSNVVLPQPEGPRMEKKLPRTTSNDSVSTARWPAKCFTRPSTPKSGVVKGRP